MVIFLETLIFDVATIYFIIIILNSFGWKLYQISQLVGTFQNPEAFSMFY